MENGSKSGQPRAHQVDVEGFAAAARRPSTTKGASTSAVTMKFSHAYVSAGQTSAQPQSLHATRGSRTAS
eukprot:5372712-Pyramimonas_sp.AAC.1